MVVGSRKKILIINLFFCFLCSRFLDLSAHSSLNAQAYSYLNSRYEKYVNAVSCGLKLHNDGEERQSSQKAMRLGHVTWVTKHMAYLKRCVCPIMNSENSTHKVDGLISTGQSTM